MVYLNCKLFITNNIFIFAEKFMKEFIIEKIQEIAFSKVEADEFLWSTKILDSITLVELIVEIETEYSIKVPFNEIIEDNFETVSRMIKYINSKL